MNLVSSRIYTAIDTIGNVLSVTSTFNNLPFTILTLTGHEDSGTAGS